MAVAAERWTAEEAGATTAEVGRWAVAGVEAAKIANVLGGKYLEQQLGTDPILPNI